MLSLPGCMSWCTSGLGGAVSRFCIPGFLVVWSGLTLLASRGYGCVPPQLHPDTWHLTPDCENKILGKGIILPSGQIFIRKKSTWWFDRPALVALRKSQCPLDLVLTDKEGYKQPTPQPRQLTPPRNPFLHMLHCFVNQFLVWILIESIESLWLLIPGYNVSNSPHVTCNTTNLFKHLSV